MNKAFYFDLIVSFLACSNPSTQKTPNDNCTTLSVESYRGETNLQKWGNEYSSSDTSDVYTYFDTLLYSKSEAINTVAFNLFKDPINPDLNIENYILNERRLIEESFFEVEFGKVPNVQTPQYYFHAKDSSSHLYFEYRFDRQIEILMITTTTEPPDILQEICYLKRISRQFNRISRS